MSVQVVYVNGFDYSQDIPQWYEEGELPACASTNRVGDLTCDCGKHHVHVDVAVDPVDLGDRMTRRVTLRKP